MRSAASGRGQPRRPRARPPRGRADPPSVRWRLVHDEPWFDNQVASPAAATAREAAFTLEKAMPDGE